MRPSAIACLMLRSEKINGGSLGVRRSMLEAVAGPGFVGSAHRNTAIPEVVAQCNE